jgi:hypothetical protein
MNRDSEIFHVLKGLAMTVKRYGRVTPLQMDMLGLGGEICRWYSQQAPSDQDRIDEMKMSRKTLRETVGCDFGYDLEAWHNYLLNNGEHSEEYTFAYAWHAVRPKILDMIKDPERFRLIRLIEMSETK